MPRRDPKTGRFVRAKRRSRKNPTVTRPTRATQARQRRSRSQAGFDPLGQSRTYARRNMAGKFPKEVTFQTAKDTSSLVVKTEAQLEQLMNLLSPSQIVSITEVGKSAPTSKAEPKTRRKKKTSTPSAKKGFGLWQQLGRATGGWPFWGPILAENNHDSKKDGPAYEFAFKNLAGLNRQQAQRLAAALKKEGLLFTSGTDDHKNKAKYERARDILSDFM